MERVFGFCRRSVSPVLTGVALFFLPGHFAMAAEPVQRPQVLEGWLNEYSTFVEQQAADQYPDLLKLSAKRLENFCPKWEQLEAVKRQKFWTDLLWSIAFFESDYQRNAIYLEPGADMDKTTGVLIHSEGLLQLSYADITNYHYHGDDLSWEKDKTLALKDYEKNAVLGDPDRTILNAYANLNLGLLIITQNLKRFRDDSLESVLSRYWSTMNPRRKVYPRLLKRMKAKATYCF